MEYVDGEDLSAQRPRLLAAERHSPPPRLVASKP
jgi:hypothetical protein